MNHLISKQNLTVHDKAPADCRDTYDCPENDKHLIEVEDQYSTLCLSGRCDAEGKSNLIIHITNSLPVDDATREGWLRHAQLQIADCLTKN